MAFGGGSYTLTNKALPGAYINFVSAARASAALGERGTAAALLPLDWGPEGVVTELAADAFAADSMALFGRDSQAPELRPVREIFRTAQKLLFYRPAGGEKAENTLAQARCGGAGGNRLSVAVAQEGEAFRVSTLLDGASVDVQEAASMADLQDNPYVVWKREASLAATAGEPLAGGADKTPEAADYSAFLQAVEPYAFQALACASTDSEVNRLFCDFTRRMREDCGVKFQTVLYRTAADYEGIISVENSAAEDAPALVYWAAGAAAGCPVTGSNSNRVYDGEYTVQAGLSQSELEAGLKEGKFLFHQVGAQIRVLSDINTLVSFTAEKSEDFAMNQTVRVLDQIANDIASLFCTRYLGVIPNDAAGRLSLWNDIVKHHQELERARAIESFSPQGVQVQAGPTKRSVVVTDQITPVCAMEQLYMTVTVA